MKRFFSAILLLGALFVAESSSAQLKTSYFMEGSYFRTDMNPALTPTRGYIALPALSGFSVGQYSNYNSFENMNYLGENGYINALNSSVPANEFLGKLPDKCVQSFRGDLGLFRLGFYTLNNTFINFGANLRVEYNYVTPKSFYKMLKGAYENSINVNDMNVDLTSYIETYAGAAFRVGENLTIGARFKFLIGLINGLYDVNKINVENGNYSVFGNMKFNSVELDSSNYNGTTNMEDIIVNDTQDFVWSNLHSFGGAIDLGAELRLLENKLKLSAAITDLGFIKWSADTQMAGKLHLEATERVDFFQILSDSSFDMPEKFYDYTTRLTANLNLGAEYNFLGNHFAVGALSHTRFYRNAVATEFTTSFNVRPTNWITLTASHTFLNGNTPGIYGAAVNIHPRAINIFFGMDYIGSKKNYVDEFTPTTMSELDQFVSPKATSYNFFVGVGFNFGRPDFLVEQH